MQLGPNKLNFHSHKSCKIKFKFKGKVQNLISVFSGDVFSAKNETQRAFCHAGWQKEEKYKFRPVLILKDIHACDKTCI